jgi:uncharacterized phage protein (TIGR02220 family)
MIVKNLQGKKWSVDIGVVRLQMCLAGSSPPKQEIKPSRVNEISDDEPNRNIRQEAREVLDFLNEKADRNFKHVQNNLRFIEQRMKEGVTQADCRKVIAKKVREWAGTDMHTYLRPQTLFNATKFYAYEGELV